ncbi:MAG: epoxyqueuosine reductase [Acidimicrobiia bacterium]
MTATAGLSELVLDYVRHDGACAAGIATVETLEGGPPSSDLTYVLPEARSAVSFALPLDESKIESYLRKESHSDHERDNRLVNTIVSGISAELAAYLDAIGHPSYAVVANNVYRREVPGGQRALLPELSHRYLAVASGVGWFGFSGNVITPTHGAGVILGSVVTTAELDPTPPLPEDERYCDDCHLCLSSCNSKLMSTEETSTVTLGGVEFSYSKRRTYQRCELVCGGFTGLNEHGKWSTWSPGRFAVPDNDDEFKGILRETVVAANKRPQGNGGIYHPLLMPGRRAQLTCGNCQLICHPDKDERKRRYRMLTKSGAVVQHPDGRLEAVSARAAEAHLAAMAPEERAAYERV